MASSIETHPQKQKIIDAILAGESCDSISKWCNPYVSSVGIWRYRRKAIQATAKAQAGVLHALEEKGILPKDSVTAEISAEAVRDVTKASLQAQPILERMRAREEDRARIMGLAEAKEDYRAWSAVDRNSLTSLELEARLTGVLDSARPTASHVTLVVLPQLPGATQQPARIEAQDVEFRALPAGDPAKNPDAE